MIEAVEQLVDKYYEDSIELPDNKWLIFTRKSEYRGSNRSAVLVTLEDLEMGTQIELAKYFDAKWYFTIPQMESIFWQNIKSYYPKFKEIFSRLRKPIPNATLLEYTIRAKQLKRAITLDETSPELIIKSDKL
jgi:hypothetical protein